MNRAMAGAAIDTLSRVPLFEELEPAELQSLADSMHERIFSAGDAATAEGEPADGFFVVMSGEGEVTVQGRPQGTVGPGDYFGEIALLMGSDRTATIRATSDLHCYALTAPDFRTIVEGNPSIAWKVIQSMAQRLS